MVLTEELPLVLMAAHLVIVKEVLQVGIGIIILLVTVLVIVLDTVLITVLDTVLTIVLITVEDIVAVQDMVTDLDMVTALQEDFLEVVRPLQ